MKTFLDFRWALLITVGLFTSFGCGVEKAEIDELAEVQEESFPSTTRAENVTIKGTVVTQETNQPLQGATVRVGDQSTTTSADGSFQLVLEETNGGNTLASIQLKGCTDLFFTVNFRRYNSGEVVDWTAQLSRLQRAIQFTPGMANSRTFNALGTIYNVDIPADAAPQPFAVHVGPSGTVVGKGIPGTFALVNLSIQTADETGFRSGTVSSSRNFRFANAIVVTFDVLKAATSGGIGSINAAVFLPSAPEEAKQAAENYIEAVNASQTVLAQGGSALDALKVLVTGLFGDEDADEDDDVDSVKTDNDGNLILSSDFSGIVLPGIGVVTRTGKLIRVTRDGEIVEEVSLVGDDSVVIPHQATADGDG